MFIESCENERRDEDPSPDKLHAYMPSSDLHRDGFTTLSARPAWELLALCEELHDCWLDRAVGAAARCGLEHWRRTSLRADPRGGDLLRTKEKFGRVTKAE